MKTACTYDYIFICTDARFSGCSWSGSMTKLNHADTFYRCGESKCRLTVCLQRRISEDQQGSRGRFPSVCVCTSAHGVPCWWLNPSLDGMLDALPSFSHSAICLSPVTSLASNIPPPSRTPSCDDVVNCSLGNG